jgi:hypothetical protein
MIGWCAVTGTIDAGAIALFLSSSCGRRRTSGRSPCSAKATTTKAGVPMLPNVAGRAETKKQILIYSLLLVPTAALPLAPARPGYLYAAGSRDAHGQVPLRCRPGLPPPQPARPKTRPARSSSGSPSSGSSLLFALILIGKALTSASGFRSPAVMAEPVQALFARRHGPPPQALHRAGHCARRADGDLLRQHAGAPWRLRGGARPVTVLRT